MQPSTLKTFTIPAVPTESPTTLAQAREAPLRVVIRNIGGTPLTVAHDAPNLFTATPDSASFRIPAGLEDTFVLAPGQRILAVSGGGAGLACVAASESFPEEKVTHA